MLRLELHPDLRVSYSDARAMSLLEILHRHAILDRIDAEKQAALPRSS